MRKRLLLAASLGVLAIMPAPASAHGPGPAHLNVGSSLGIRIIVRDGPKVVHHYDHARRHLRPQPSPRRFSHHAPAWRWHGPSHHRRQHFHWRDHEHRPWLRAPRAQHFKHGHAKQWLHAPWHHGAPAAPATILRTPGSSTDTPAPIAIATATDHDLRRAEARPERLPAGLVVRAGRRTTRGPVRQQCRVAVGDLPSEPPIEAEQVMPDVANIDA